MKSIDIQSLRFEHLSFKFDNSDPIFENVDFNFPMEDFVWVKSSGVGSGRSTLLQILAGLLPDVSGKYFINDKDVNEMSFDEFLPYRLAVGYSFDMGGILHNRTIKENLLLPVLYHELLDKKEADKKVMSVLEHMGIQQYYNLRPSEVPGGIRKHVCVLRPLLMNPQVLLLDDPAMGLSHASVLKYLDLIHDLRKEGYAKHIFVKTFDEKMMSMVQHQEIFVDSGQIYHNLNEDIKKVVHL
jgi:phospholipid/cholesterol/gamma-HCH transport system ATP-binding protein